MHLIIRTIAIIGLILFSQMAHADVFTVAFSTAEIDGNRVMNIADVAIAPSDTTKASLIDAYNEKFKQAKPDRFSLFKDKLVKSFKSNAEAQTYHDDLIENSKAAGFTVELLGANTIHVPPALNDTSWPFNTSEAKKRQAETAINYHLNVEEKAVGLDFILIPPGEFMMGSPSDEEGRNDDEIPHLVKISKPFYMARDESKLPGKTFDEIRQWLAKLQANAPNGFAFRLPTEAEWEYAARAGKATAYYTGGQMYGAQYEESSAFDGEYQYSNCNGDVLNLEAMPTKESPECLIYKNEKINECGRGIYGYHGCKEIEKERFTLKISKRGTPKEVRLFQPNSWGLYDMPGRMSELVEDKYATYATKDTAQIDPLQKSGMGHVIRGGNFRSKIIELRSASRKYVDDAKLDPNLEFQTVGVRLVMIKLEDYP